MCFITNIQKFIHSISKHAFNNNDIEKLIRARSHKEVVSEINDHLSEKQLQSDDGKDMKLQQPAYLGSKTATYVW